MLSKSTYILAEPLVEAIKNNDPERPILKAEEELDLYGNYHILRRTGDRLTMMTPEQTRYAATHPVALGEANPKTT
ncbi:MAG: hypothetical protein ACE5J7_03500 [Candidatus Aenigmatarchaeota archaeon]